MKWIADHPEVQSMDHVVTTPPQRTPDSVRRFSISPINNRCVQSVICPGTRTTNNLYVFTLDHKPCVLPWTIWGVWQKPGEPAEEQATSVSALMDVEAASVCSWTPSQQPLLCSTVAAKNLSDVLTRCYQSAVVVSGSHPNVSQVPLNCKC